MSEKLLKIISKETLEAIDSMDIVTPSIYTKVFHEKAKSHKFDLEDEMQLSQEILDIECQNLIEMREQNKNNAIKLSTSTSKAIDAIKKKDEDSLGEVLKETQKLKREIENLKEEVYKDELTGVHNRKWLRDYLLNHHNDNFNTDGSIVIVDIDYFKAVNDEHGHAIGDKVLIFVANNLKKTKGEVVRYGGDEFLIVFGKEIALEEVVSRVDKINNFVTHKKLKAKKGEFKITFSIGIAHFKKEDIFSDVLEAADKKMYKNKEEMKRLNDS
jgi:diguanylate cyclase (GGDEF)-like protein